ncbi:MAG: hypothetical protein LBG89_03765 [Rickettsiales bacterium]|jgi:hypothetical protein|nr:hypothetical protein [Rickettsiales bacterium]
MAKKSVKKTAMKPAAKAAPAVKAAPAAACGCGCGCGGKFKWVKKILVLLVVFALGFAACCAMCGGKCWKGHMGKMNRGAALFDKNGCLNVAAMEKKMQGKFTAQQLAAADANNDGCITKEEFKGMRFGAADAAQSGQPKPKRVRRVAAPVQQ